MTTSPPDEREYFATWNQFHDRRLYAQAAGKLRDQGADPERLRILDEAAAKTPAVCALDALQANARLVELLTGRRWYVMQAARQEGAGWAEIGGALGISKQAAWEFYKRKIEAQETYVADLHDVDSARAVL